MHTLEIDESTNEIYINHCKKTLKKHKKYIIWGTGQGAEKLIEFIELQNLLPIEIVFVDNNKLKTGNLFLDKYKIYSPDYLSDYSSENSMLIITCADCDSVFEQAKDLFCGNIIVMDFAWMDFKNNFNDFFTSRKHDFEKSFNLLADDLSKRTFSCLINYKISRNPIWLKKISLEYKKKYFDETVINLNNNETFIDCGSFIGETVLDFVDKVSEYNRIICIEPDNCNFIKLLKNFNENDVKNCVSYNVALSNVESIDSFSSGLNYSSNQKLNDNGNCLVKTCKLDNLLNQINVSFIKMDVEGSEIQALEGAQETIKRNSPKLAICAYHKWSDFIEIPQFIKSINIKYKIYMRHYSSGTEFETIIYAKI